MDVAVKQFCVEKENCRQACMLRAIGSHEHALSASCHCCDICTPLIPSALSFESDGKPTERRKRRVALREVSEYLQKETKEQLLKECEEYIKKHPYYRMIGADFVVPLAVIDNICLNLQYVDSVDNITDGFEVRPDLKDKSFNVIMEVVRNAPAQKRARRVLYV